MAKIVGKPMKYQPPDVIKAFMDAPLSLDDDIERELERLIAERPILAFRIIRGAFARIKANGLEVMGRDVRSCCTFEEMKADWEMAGPLREFFGGELP